MQRRHYPAVLLERISLLDLGITRACNRLCRASPSRRFFAVASRLGDGVYWYGMMLALPVFFGQAGMTTSLRMALAGALGVLIYKAIKSRTARPRPFVRSHRIAPGTAPLDQYSFPSGHTLHATAFTLVAVFSLPVLFWWTVPFAICVALSRLALGLHYPSDVLAGAAIGAGLAALALAV